MRTRGSGERDGRVEGEDPRTEVCEGQHRPGDPESSRHDAKAYRKGEEDGIGNDETELREPEFKEEGREVLELSRTSRIKVGWRGPRARVQTCPKRTLRLGRASDSVT